MEEYHDKVTVHKTVMRCCSNIYEPRERYSFQMLAKNSSRLHPNRNTRLAKASKDMALLPAWMAGPMERRLGTTNVRRKVATAKRFRSTFRSKNKFFEWLAGKFFRASYSWQKFESLSPEKSTTLQRSQPKAETALNQTRRKAVKSHDELALKWLQEWNVGKLLCDAVVLSSEFFLRKAAMQSLIDTRSI